MTEDEVAELIRRVEAYLAAYRERIAPPAEGNAPPLYAGWELRNEYRAVLDFAYGLTVSKERYDNKTFESYVDDMLTAALRAQDSVEDEVRGLAAILNHNLLTHLYIPLDGVTSDSATHDIGAIKIIRMDDEAFERLVIEPASDILRENPRFDDKDVAVRAETYRKELESLRGRCCVEISTDLDIPKTFEFAQDSAVARLCDFLQFTASLFLAHDKTLKISWATDAGLTCRWAFAVSDGPAKSSNRSAERVSAGYSFEITTDRVAKIKDLGLDRVADIVGRKAPTEYDEMLQTSVRWFAKGEREEHPDDRKLSYVTAVDLFFSEEGRGATKRICTGFAFALARDNDAVPGLARYMFHIFASRSATSHAGELGVMEPKELDSLRRHVQQFIIAMAQRQFSSKDEVKDWIADKETTLTSEQRGALSDATNWKVVDAELYITDIADALRYLLPAKLLGAEDAKKAFEISRVFRDAVRAGGRFVHELRPLLPNLDPAHDAIVELIAKGTVDKAAAKTYLDAVIQTFSAVSWVKDAIDKV